MKFPFQKVAAAILVCAFVAVAGSPDVRAATVAYWRFETGPANTSVLHSGADGAFSGTTPDVSGNGNSLSAWTQGGYAGFAYRTDVSFASVPQNGATNKFSVKNTGGYPALFTSASGSTSGINLKAITPAQFTIEASYKPEANGGYRTIVGRDAQNVATSDASLAALYLQVRPDDSVGIQFTDVAGYTHSAYSPPGWLYGFNASTNAEGVGAPWYNLAAVNDGSTLKLYVNNVLVAATDLTLSGSPNLLLAVGTTSGSDWSTGAWSVGRGLYGGNHTDRAVGFIDEVRISNSALKPGEFLAAARPQIKIVAVSGSNLTFNVTSGQPGATGYVLQSTNAALPVAGWTRLATNGFDANGNFTTATPINPAKPQNFFCLVADLLTAASGPLTYELASGSESWPAGIRDQIVYAMDGAVAQYNRYGTFHKHLYANYNSGVPTAQASYSGWIDFGGQIGYRTALHEISHTLGVGTYGTWSSFIQSGVWTGTNGVQQIHAFDGSTASVNSDGTHFWPYGLNYENEASTENNRRHVFMVAAFRRDLGIE
jgi:hypothetical protein